MPLRRSLNKKSNTEDIADKQGHLLPNLDVNSVSSSIVSSTLAIFLHGCAGANGYH